MSDDEYEALEERAAIIQFCSGREVSRTDAWRMACEQASQQGYVETLFGRRLYLPDIQAKNPALRKGAERTAINAPMQGTAADIIKRAMIAVDGWLQDSGLDARVILQVHDELVLEVREDLVEQVREAICPLMSGAAQLDVPLLVEAGVGNNWDEAH